MDIQYKPTKQKKEKPPKAPKAPKAEKAMKFSPTVQSVKASKPKKEKTPKIKNPKPEKAMAMEFGKPVKPEKAGKERKAINPKVAVAIVAAVIAVAAVVLAFAIPAARERGMQIESISVSALPYKTKYLVGEEVDFDGLRVLVTRKNGETFTVRADKCVMSGFDSTKENLSQQIIVRYGSFSDVFYISVEEPPKATPALKSIRMEKLPKTEYSVGEWLDTTGGLIRCEYVDGTYYDINLTNGHIDGFIIDSVAGTYVTQQQGIYELTVQYMENGVLEECTYTITVTE